MSLHRRYLGLSRNGLAEAMEVDSNSIKRWKNNDFTLKNFKSYLSKRKRQKLQKILGIQNLCFYPETQKGNLHKHLVTLGQHLKYRRFEEAAPIDEVAKSLGLSRVNYANWENDKIQQINPERFIKLIDYIGYCPIENYSTPAEKLALFRKHAGLTCLALSKVLRCNKDNISHWESGRCQIPECKKKQLEDIFQAVF